MNYANTDESGVPQARADHQDSNPARESADAGSPGRPAEGGAQRPATVIVRGETVADDHAAKQPESSKQQGSSTKKVSAAKVDSQSRLPVLEDDGDVGVQKDQVVVRDGKPDLAFTGTLLASAAPSSAPEGHWDEYRVYATSAGKHVFSKVTRTIVEEEQDEHAAEIFDPAPSSVPSKLLRSARDLTRSHPVTWTDAAVDFFGYDPLAKALYRKLGDGFEEHVS